MHRCIHFLFWTCFTAVGTLRACDLAEIRGRFARAAEDEKTASTLMEQIKNCKEKSGLLTGYLGATEALMGKHAFLPTSKYSWCKHSETDFETAVSMDPDNLEIRYLRLAVETNLPAFLNMSKHVESDKKTVLKLLPASADPALNAKAARLLIDQGSCTKEELIILRRYVH